eukprot:2879538-Alexandrium_andersonii.AAC.1
MTPRQTGLHPPTPGHLGLVPAELVGRDGPGLVCGSPELVQEGVVLVDPLVAEGFVPAKLDALVA